MAQLTAKYIILLLISITFFNPSNAEISPSFDLDKMIGKSDFIAVVSNTKIQNRYSINHALKGHFKIGDDVDFNQQIMPMTLVDERRLKEGSMAILVFATSDKASSGKFILYNNFYSTLFVPPDINLGSDDINKNIKTCISQGLLSRDDLIVKDAVTWVRHFNDEVIYNEAENIIASSDSVHPGIVAIYLERNVPFGNSEIIRKAVSFYDTNVKILKDQDYCIWVAWSFSKIIKTDDVKFLNEILLRSDYLGTSLIYSANKWCNKSSLKSLKTVIESPDPAVAYRGIKALCKLYPKSLPREAMNGVAIDNFEEKPEKYLPAWRGFIENEIKASEANGHTDGN